jgi:hypothetical protein
VSLKKTESKNTKSTMTEEEKEIKQGNFIEWTTFIEDRVDEWFKSIKVDLSNQLDYSPDSLITIEEYILSNFTKDSLSNEKCKMQIDATISYYAETLLRNLPESTWFLDIDDESSYYYNLPSIKTTIGTMICPHKLLPRIIHKNKGTFLFDFFNKRLGFIKKPETY